jgi:hypothetical protein
VITSEGIASRLIPPWVRLFVLDGRQLEDLPVPLAFILDAIPQTRGVRQNLGFESGATVGPYFFTGSEGALVQDGPPAGGGVPSPPRLLRYNLKTGEPAASTCSGRTPSPSRRCRPRASPSTASSSSSRSESAASSRWSARSRWAPPTRGTRSSSTRSSSPARRTSTGARAWPASSTRCAGAETLLLDLDALGIPLDNVEGMAFGPDLADGRRALVLVSDNNFAPAQFTQFLLLAFSDK